jgi:hypothetical protein
MGVEPGLLWKKGILSNQEEVQQYFACLAFGILFLTLLKPYLSKKINKIQESAIEEWRKKQKK